MTVAVALRPGGWGGFVDDVDSVITQSYRGWCVEIRRVVERRSQRPLFIIVGMARRFKEIIRNLAVPGADSGAVRSSVR